jgi:hypothetical protein
VKFFSFRPFVAADREDENDLPLDVIVDSYETEMKHQQKLADEAHRSGNNDLARQHADRAEHLYRLLKQPCRNNKTRMIALLMFGPPPQGSDACCLPAFCRCRYCFPAQTYRMPPVASPVLMSFLLFGRCRMGTRAVPVRAPFAVVPWCRRLFQCVSNWPLLHSLVAVLFMTSVFPTCASLLCCSESVSSSRYSVT